MNLAGLPAHTSLSGISFVTTELAPTIAFLPIVTALHIIVLQPMNAFSFIRTFPKRNLCLYLSPSSPALLSKKWDNMTHPFVIHTPLSIDISSGWFVSKSTCSPIKILSEGLLIATPPYFQ